MAWLDYFKTVTEQLAMLLSGTTEAGAAIAGPPVHLTAGTAVAGKVGIDQTTPGTTNAVDAKTIGGVAPALDSTNKLGVSLYAKGTVAGDSPLSVVSAAIPYLRATLYSSGGSVIQTGTYAADGLLTNPTGLYALAVGYAYNGASLDRLRNNEAATLLASAARTATASSADQTNYNGRGVRVFINVTAAADTPSITVAIETKDPVSGTYTALLTSAAITGTGHTVLSVYPGITAAANVSAAMVVGRVWRVTVTHADADSITYSVGAVTIL